MRKLIAVFVLMFIFIAGCTAKNNSNEVNNGIYINNTNTSNEQTKIKDSSDKQINTKETISKGLAVDIFYASMSEDPDSLSPDVTYPSKITVSGENREEAAKNAINILLAGPSDDEKKKGFYSAIPEGTKLNFIKKEGKKVIADFSSKLNAGGGSCDMQQRRSQIENTLKGIYSDDDAEIIISVNGNTDQVLQP